MRDRKLVFATILVLLFGVNSLLFSEVPTDLGTFQREITPSNPYLQNVNSLVNQSLKRYTRLKDKTKYDRGAFRNGTIPWIIWGYGDKNSKHYGDTTYLNTAIKMMDVLFTHQDDPSLLTQSAEIFLPVYLIKQYGAPDSVIIAWGEKYMEKKLNNIYGWTKGQVGPGKGATTNITHAYAAMLEYGSQILGSYPKWKEDAKKWHDVAKKAIDKIDGYILPDGAFIYHHHGSGHTGPAAAYDNINMLNLVHYYFITGDPVAKHGIAMMAKRYRIATRTNSMETVSLPYWKDEPTQWRGVGWPSMRYAAYLAEDHVVLAMSMVKKKYLKIDIGSFPTMYFWNKNLEPGDVPTKFTQYNATTGGPILRWGDLSVYMTSHCKSATPIQMIYTDSVNHRTVRTSEVSLVIKRGNGILFDLPASDALENQSVIITPNWVAMGTKYTTRGAIVGGEGKPNGWNKSELWFADSSGFFGGTVLDCHKDSKFEGVYGYIRFTDTSFSAYDTANLTFTKAGLTYSFYGDSITRMKDSVTLRNNSKVHGVTAILSNGAKSAFKSGETFSYGVTMQHGDRVVYESPKYQKVGDLMIRSFTKDGKSSYIVYNGGDSTLSWRAPVTAGNIWYSEENKKSIITPKAYRGDNISISSKQLVVVREGNPIAIKSTKLSISSNLFSISNRTLTLNQSANIDKIVLFNVRGVIVREFNNLESRKEISLKDVKSGFYIVKAISQDGLAISRKTLLH